MVDRSATIRLECSTACSLRCPSCPTAQGTIARSLGTGFLRADAFRSLLDENRWVRRVELASWGEIFSNPELIPILETAHRRGVLLSADSGVHLNGVSGETLEALVRHSLRSMKCSIDGATPEIYRIYRQGGDLTDVLDSIRRLNALKKRYGSPYPVLKWQFILFAHNAHELGRAREMARTLGMRFKTKLPWPDGDGPAEFRTAGAAGPTSRGGLFRLLRSVDREIFRDRRKRRRASALGPNPHLVCSQLWLSPQINWDGRVLGCCVNTWGDFGNAFAQGLGRALADERLERARRMLLGQAEPRPDVPCSTCVHYRTMASSESWMQEPGVGLVDRVRRFAASLSARLLDR